MKDILRTMLSSQTNAVSYLDNTNIFLHIMALLDGLMGLAPLIYIIFSIHFLTFCFKIFDKKWMQENNIDSLHSHEQAKNHRQAVFLSKCQTWRWNAMIWKSIKVLITRVKTFFWLARACKVFVTSMFSQLFNWTKQLSGFYFAN